ncbi:hypothetical protein [Metapseudomonas otitidis]|uniref:hypothetical protein n=1 Tax=Metapseudomonas otitidis TaxID=319939 RepID=UPI001F22ADD8|nr:hypothetical protein [Pseudomonas otitidis]
MKAVEKPRGVSIANTTGVLAKGGHIQLTEFKQSSDELWGISRLVDAPTQIASPWLAEELALGIEHDQGVTAGGVLVAVPAADIPADEER